MNIRLLASLVLVACVAAGCGRHDNQNAAAAPSGSTVSIVSIVPAASESLSPGQKVSLHVKAAYTLTAESGTLGLVVQDSNNKPLAQTVNAIFKGSGVEEFNVEFTVPETKAVQVFVPLSAQDQGATSTVSSRAFKVVTR